MAFTAQLVALRRQERIGWLGFGITTLTLGVLLYALNLPQPPYVQLGPLRLGLGGARLGALDTTRALGIFSLAGLAARWIPVRDLLPLVARRAYPFYVAGSLIRIVPTLRDDAQRIQRSQRARGHEPPRHWYRPAAYLPILIPLFVSTLRRAREQAIAMDLAGLAPKRRRR